MKEIKAKRPVIAPIIGNPFWLHETAFWNNATENLRRHHVWSVCNILQQVINQNASENAR